MSRSALFRVLVGIAAALLIVPAGAAAKPKKASITEVGHEPLLNRGMNAAIAVNGDYAYIGSRTDGSHPGLPTGGIMVVDISKPHKPQLVTQNPIDPAPGESSRELR